jgi:hypothetical protein
MWVTADVQDKFTFADRDSNQYHCNEIGLLTLKLNNSKRKARNIGQIFVAGQGSYSYRKQEKWSTGYHKESKSFSIPYAILERLGEQGNIVYYTEKATYKISASKAREKGSVKWFKFSPESTERKVYIALEFWEKLNV